MSALAIIVAMSTILWIFIDRAKKFWENISFGSWITTGVALISSMLISFGYNLDLLVALGIMENISIGGIIFAGLAITGGSSVIAEIISRIKDGKTYMLEYNEDSEVEE